MNRPQQPPGPLRTRLYRAAQEAQVPREAVLIDWATGHLLQGIASHPVLGVSAVFKGGTSLRKTISRDWRFSLDLDFSNERVDSCDAMLVMVQEAAADAIRRVESVGELRIECRQLVQREPHPGNQCVFRIEVTLPWGERTILKLEVTQDEPILLPVRPRDILHGYPPEPDTLGQIRTYDVDEVAAEKLRAYLQVYETLRRRELRSDRQAWVKGRSRDTYDLGQLHRSGRLHPDRIALILPRKVAARGVTFDGPGSFQRPEIMNYYRTDWAQNLVPFVPQTMAPLFDDAVADVEELIAGVFRHL